MRAKKSLILTLILAFVFMSVAGCGSESTDYPVIDLKDTSNLTLATATLSPISVSYESDTWAQLEDASMLTVYLTETYGTASNVNINVQSMGEYSSEITEEDRKELMETFDTMGGYITFEVSEMRTLDGKPVIYTESTMQFTDAYIDLMIESGAITEEYLDTYGGREVFLNMAPTKQIVIYALADGNLCTYIGTYYEEEQKQLVLDEITVLYATTQID